MNTKHTNQEITWKTYIIYEDINTEEILTKNEVINNYIKTKKTKHVEIYKTFGKIIYIYKCTRTTQLKLFE